MGATAVPKPYRRDLTDDEWDLRAPLLPPSGPAGAPRTTALSEVLNAVLDRRHNGCAGHALPHDFPPEGTVRDYFHRWRKEGTWERLKDVRCRPVRPAEGRDEDPAAGIVESQSAKGTRTSGTKGYDAGKQVTGTKRHLNERGTDPGGDGPAQAPTLGPHGEIPDCGTALGKLDRSLT